MHDQPGRLVSLACLPALDGGDCLCYYACKLPIEKAISLNSQPVLCADMPFEHDPDGGILAMQVHEIIIMCLCRALSWKILMRGKIWISALAQSPTSLSIQVSDP